MTNSAPSYWLLKTEPGTYAFKTLLKEKKTNWDNVRNYQARIYLRQMAKNDIALIYHSGDDKAVMGIAKITHEAYPDLDPEGGDWVQVDVAAVEALPESVSLKQIKATKELADMLLIKNSRLSCMPITAQHYKTILKLGGLKA